MRGIIDFGYKQRVRDRRKSASCDEAFWWWSRCLKIV